MGEIKKINLNISDLKQSEKEIKDKKEDFKTAGWCKAEILYRFIATGLMV